MRFLTYLTTFLILLMIPATAVGAYLAYTQARAETRRVNDTTPLADVDVQNAVRLLVGLDEAEATEGDDAPFAAARPELAPFAPTPPPMEIGTNAEAESPGTETTSNTPPETNSIDAALATPTGDSAAPAEAVSPPTEIDPRRKTVLLMGIDQRQGEEGPFRTDTMIVLSIDPIGRTGAMLSIPRDLWVTIPGTSRQARINTANVEGDRPDLDFPDGGPGMAMLTVERLLGVPIDHYVLVNFDAFTTFIDTIGPVEICPQERIYDDKYPDGSYGTIIVEIEAGCQDMDAETLLQYARTRATEGGDFDRANRQQEVILAIRDEILTAGGVSALLGDAYSIWESVSANVRTDLSLDDMIALALAAAEVNDIRTATIGTGEVFPGTADDGSDILIPIQSDILSLVSDLFRPPSRPALSVEEGVGIEIDPDNLPLNIRREAPIIALLNGTEIQGRAGALRAYILSYSLDVGMVGNAATTDNVESYIVYYGDHAESAEYVAAVLALINGNNMPRIEQRDGEDERGDVIVVIGTDLAVPQSSE